MKNIFLGLLLLLSASAQAHQSVEIASVVLPLRDGYYNQLNYLTPEYYFDAKSGAAWVVNTFTDRSQTNIPQDLVDFRGSWQVPGLVFDAAKKQILLNSVTVASLKKGLFGLDYLEEEKNTKLTLWIDQRLYDWGNGDLTWRYFEVLSIEIN